MAGTTVTTKAKKKMLQARAGIAPLSKIVGMAFGTGGVNTSDVIVPHSPRSECSAQRGAEKGSGWIRGSV